MSLEELLGSLEVAVVRDHDARLALDWLHHERNDVGVGFEGRLEGTEVVVGDDAEALASGARSRRSCWGSVDEETAARVRPQKLFSAKRTLAELAGTPFTS